MNELAKLLTPEEIREQINDLARNGQSSDKRWALNILRHERETEAILNQPLEDAEIITRLVRVMRPAGPDACSIAFRRCWPLRGADGIKKRPTIREQDISPEQWEAVKDITSLKKYYKAFPEVKPRGGFPKGYPWGRGAVAQRDWCRRAAALILADKEQANIDAQIAEEKGVQESPA